MSDPAASGGFPSEDGADAPGGSTPAPGAERRRGPVRPDPPAPDPSIGAEIEKVPGPGTRYDWEPVRQTFVEGLMDTDGAIRWLNLREVSEHHGVPYRTCREQSSRHHWHEARAVFQGQMEATRRAERMQHAAQEFADLDSKALIVAKVGMQLVQTRLGQVLRTVTEAERNREQVDVYVEPVDARELGALAAAAEKYRELGAAALGYPGGTVALEISGPEGGPIRTDVREEMMFDDDDDSRLRGILEILARSGLALEPGSSPEPEIQEP